MINSDNLYKTLIRLLNNAIISLSLKLDKLDREIITFGTYILKIFFKVFFNFNLNQFSYQLCFISLS